METRRQTDRQTETETKGEMSLMIMTSISLIKSILSRRSGNVLASSVRIGLTITTNTTRKNNFKIILLLRLAPVSGIARQSV